MPPCRSGTVRASSAPPGDVAGAVGCVDDEAHRLAALRGLDILDSAAESEFDDLAELAAITFGAPIALISLIDSDRQWFKVHRGLAVEATRRDIAFCDHTIRSDEPLVVLDARADPRFATNPLVTGAPEIRFYAGTPLAIDGFRIGTICVIDHAPRAGFSKADRTRLQSLARSVTKLLGTRAAALRSERLARALDEHQARLDQNVEFFRALAAQVPDVIIRYDLEGVIEYASPAILTVFGYEPAAVVGRNIRMFIANPGQSRTLKSVLAGQAPPTGVLNQFQVLRQDGRPIWVQGHPAAIFDEAGKPAGVVTVVRDIEDQRAMEQELHRKHAEAQAAAVAKSQFLANMSHEIRTPLTSVIGFTKLLKTRDDLTPTSATYAQRIATSADALLSVVNDILDFSKLEAGQVELDPQPFSPLELVQQAAGLIQAQAVAKGLTIELSATDLPALVCADSSRLRQVLLNLLSNAVKFTLRGHVRLEASYDKATGRLHLVISDTGIGIPPERRDRLFQRFSQVDGSNSRQYGGTGLGLAISKGLVEAMGGEIRVESELDVGSRFSFSVVAPLATSSVDAEGLVSDETPAQQPTLGRTRLLVVDDVRMNRELVCAMLAPFDVDVTQAADGATAVATAMGQSFDLILMDLQMPGMDGLAATRAIRANSELNRGIPILALSANVLPAHVEASRRAGMNDHIGKPISPEELLTKIALWTSEPDEADAALSAQG
jgi:PAS domain S-box-containing protein